ncbi:Shootin-1, partial [Anabarilius grahami]
SVSHRVIEEVNNIQENLEIEKTCRESVEALASKSGFGSAAQAQLGLKSEVASTLSAQQLNRQNRSLKRKSMLYMSRLGADVIADINLDDEDEEDQQEESSGVCSSSHCQIVITELRDKLEVILAEKKQIVIDLEATREQLCQTRQELLKEKHDNTVLIAETFQQKKLLGKYNRVSQYALDEFEALQEDLKLERDLRSEAEKFAHEMLIEQKKLKRQSQMLIQTVSPAEALQKALAEINSLTHTLETQRLEHQQQVKALEEQIHSSELKKQLTALQRQTELLEEENKEWQHKHTKAETEAKDLRFTEKDIKQQAVDEMMQRIKNGVQLRRVTQTTNRARPGPTSVKRPPPSSSPGTRPPSPKSELEKALHRRREALNAAKNNTNPSSVLDLTQIEQSQPEPGQHTREQDKPQHTPTTVCTDLLKPS